MCGQTETFWYLPELVVTSLVFEEREKDTLQVRETSKFKSTPHRFSKEFRQGFSEVFSNALYDWSVHGCMGEGLARDLLKQSDVLAGEFQ